MYNIQNDSSMNIKNRGGKRIGAGRPKGQGKYQEPTKPIRVPHSLLEKVQGYIASKGYQIPLYSSSVQAGFPSPADDYIDTKLDLNKHLIKHPTATFFVRAEGDSMIGAGIHSGDILIVDKSLEVSDGKIVIAALDGHLTVKRLQKIDGKILLMSENKSFKPIEIIEGNELIVWGIVTHVLHQV